VSHISECQLVIADLEVLDLACADLSRRLGRTVELKRDVPTYRWYGRWVGDTPMPAGLSESDLGMCDHRIEVDGCRYDVGVCQRTDGVPGYSLRYDWWSSGGLSKALGGNELPELLLAINRADIQRTYGDRYTFEERVLPNGDVELVAMEG
jgi:hypothetical protein